MRPWSFSASGTTTLLAAAVISRDVDVDYVRLLFALGTILSVHAGANLVNTLCDFRQGADSKASDDRTLVDGVVDATDIERLAGACYAVGALLSLPLLDAWAVIACGAALGVAYTAAPLQLKYRALGDVVIVACFGPLIVAAVGVALRVGPLHGRAMATTLPLWLLTEGILHANNMRDAAPDARAGVRTLAQSLGRAGARGLLFFLLVAPFVSVVLLAWHQHAPSLLLPLVTAPIAVPIVRRAANDQLQGAPQAIAQLQLPFGALLILGVLLATGGA